MDHHLVHRQRLGVRVLAVHQHLLLEAEHVAGLRRAPARRRACSVHRRRLVHVGLGVDRRRVQRQQLLLGARRRRAARAAPRRRRAASLIARDRLRAARRSPPSSGCTESRSSCVPAYRTTCRRRCSRRRRAGPGVRVARPSAAMISNVSAHARSCDAGMHTHCGPLQRIRPRLSACTYGLGQPRLDGERGRASSIYMDSGAETPSSPRAAASVRLRRDAERDPEGLQRPRRAP